ncbi:MAG: hypothetical protein LBK94_11905 [Prevotellaceae bacterium]|jgi:uncharacterized membrane protein|nr:hypothetical protein [Prevotellaceae bacterium]
MKNPVDYLWYKMHRLSFYTHDINPAITMSSVLFANCLTLMILISGGISSFSIAFTFILSFFFSCPYEKHKKQVKIIRTYYNESEKSRVRGNIIVALYVILSFVVLFLVANYHITIQNIL